MNPDGHEVQIGFGTAESLIQWVSGEPFPKIYWMVCEADHSLPSNAEIYEM
jgi:hypothetical protein